MLSLLTDCISWDFCLCLSVGSDPDIEPEASNMGSWSRKKGTEDSEPEDARVSYIGIAYPSSTALVGPDQHEGRRLTSHHRSWLPSAMQYRCDFITSDDHTDQDSEGDLTIEISEKTSDLLPSTSLESGGYADSGDSSTSDVLSQMKRGFPPTPSLTWVESSSEEGSVLSIGFETLESSDVHDVNMAASGRRSRDSPASSSDILTNTYSNTRSHSPLDEAIMRTEREFLQRFPKEKESRGQSRGDTVSASGSSVPVNHWPTDRVWHLVEKANPMTKSFRPYELSSNNARDSTPLTRALRLKALRASKARLDQSSRG